MQNLTVLSSDHNLISVVKMLNGKFQRSPEMKCRSFKNFIYDDFDWLLRNVGIDEIADVADPEEQVLRLTAAMNVVADTTCPVKVTKSREFHTAWMTDDLRALLDKRDLLYKSYQNLIRSNLGRTDQADRVYREFKSLKNHLRKLIPKRKKLYTRDRINSNRVEDPKVCWNLMNA